MRSFEVNFDGLVGPTHNYAGLSFGNVASMANADSVSNPQQAALQGLEKMWFLHQLGIPQGVLPPPPRPDVHFLRTLGFEGSPGDILRQASRTSPTLLHAVYSASSMWAANAATISPSADTIDGKLHITPANLISNLHRSLEPAYTSRLLHTLFADTRYFVHHHPLPASAAMTDEGAANHSRLTPRHGEAGLELFVYGQGEQNVSLRFPARQHLQACAAIARLHHLAPERTYFIRQNPVVIDAGVFHNDVIAVSNENVLLLHETAWENQNAVIAELNRKLPGGLHLLQVAEKELSVPDAVGTYLFNSQIVTLPDGGMAIIAPHECEVHGPARNVLDRIVQSDNPVRIVHYRDLRESMRNGGGPACLRLRVVLTEAELAATHQPVLLTQTLYIELTEWVKKHYRDKLHAQDLLDPQLIDENYTALDALTSILGLGRFYDFQKT